MSLAVCPDSWIMHCVTHRVPVLWDCQVLTYIHSRVTCFRCVIYVRGAREHYPLIQKGSDLYPLNMCIAMHVEKTMRSGLNVKTYTKNPIGIREIKKSSEEVIRISHVKPAISDIKYGQSCQDTLHLWRHRYIFFSSSIICFPILCNKFMRPLVGWMWKSLIIIPCKGIHERWHLYSKSKCIHHQRGE